MHKKLGQWLRAINEEVLEPVGCFAKLQMVSETISTGPNSSYTEERAWMAVALTPEESEKLRGEVGLIGLLEELLCAKPNFIRPSIGARRAALTSWSPAAQDAAAVVCHA